MTTCAEYITLLAEAQAALHRVTLGDKVATIRAGEKSIEYSKDTNISDLRTYIRDLQAKVDACNGVTTGKRRIIRFIPEDFDPI